MITAIVNCPGKTAPPTDSLCAYLQGAVLPRLIEGLFLAIHWTHMAIRKRKPWDEHNKPALYMILLIIASAWEVAGWVALACVRENKPKLLA